MQRALIQYRDPGNYALVKEALLREGRQDLIGFGDKFLIEGRGPRQAHGGASGRRQAGDAISGGMQHGASGRRQAGDTVSGGMQHGASGRRQAGCQAGPAMPSQAASARRLRAGRPALFQAGKRLARESFPQASGKKGFLINKLAYCSPELSSRSHRNNLLDHSSTYFFSGPHAIFCRQAKTSEIRVYFACVGS